MIKSTDIFSGNNFSNLCVSDKKISTKDCVISYFLSSDRTKKYYDQRCIFNSDKLQGSSCIVNKGCIAITQACDNEPYNAFCGLPELAWNSDLSVNKDKNVAFKFADMSKQPVLRNCAMQLLVSGKLIGSKNKYTSEVNFADDYYDILSHNLDGDFSQMKYIRKTSEQAKLAIVDALDSEAQYVDAFDVVYQGIGHEAKKLVYYYAAEKVLVSLFVLFALLSFSGVCLICITCSIFFCVRNNGNTRKYDIELSNRDTSNIRRYNNQNNRFEIESEQQAQTSSMLGNCSNFISFASSCCTNLFIRMLNFCRKNNVVDDTTGRSRTRSSNNSNGNNRNVSDQRRKGRLTHSQQQRRI